MISVFGSLVGDDEIENVKKVLGSQWLGMGKTVDEFELEYKNKFNLSSFALVDSGSNALFMVITLLDLPKNSEIILPSYTWVSCATAIILAGHKPIFADVDIDSMNITAEHIKEKITNKTAAIMVVHYAGLPVEMDEILELGYPVIEDAAHAVDSIYNGQPCGNIGDVGIFSFDAVKNLTVGEGGGVVTKRPELIEKAKILRYCGIGKSGFESAAESLDDDSRWWEYNIEYTFIKMLPTNLAASIGLGQLKRIDNLQKRRAEIWDIYQKELSEIDPIKLPLNQKIGDKHSYFTFAIRCPKRDKLANYLLKEGIYTTLRYHPLHLNSIYGHGHERLRNTELLNEEALSIPLHPRLSDNEVEIVIDRIKSFYSDN